MSISRFINKIRRVAMGAFYAFITLAAVSIIVVGSFVVFYALFHSDLETEYRTIEVIQFEDTLKIKHGIPFYDDFCRISERPYSINAYDCSNKTVEYILLLKKAGLNCRVILTTRGEIGHALVYVMHYGFFDPTNKSYTSIPGTKDPLREFENDIFLTYMYGYFVKSLTLSDAMSEYPEEFK